MVFIFSIIVSKFKNLKNIKILATDVDCVLTDCGMYYTSEGDYMKKFHTRDGMGIALLRKCGISTIIVTKEKTKIVRNWAKKMKIDHVYDGIIDKEKILIKASLQQSLLKFFFLSLDLKFSDTLKKHIVIFLYHTNDLSW